MICGILVMRGVRLATLAVFLVVGLLIPSSGRAAETREFAAAADINSALEHLLDARVALESWKRERLSQLQAEGQASWREVADQQVAVQSLLAWRSAAEEFSTFLAAHGGRPETELTVNGIADEGKEQPEGLRAYAQRVAMAEQRVRGVASISNQSDKSNELQRANMELDIARAELLFAEAKWRNVSASSGRHREESISATGADSDCSPAVKHAVLKLASAQSQARGELRAAEIAAQQQNLKLAAIEKLRSDGLATRGELDTARDKARAAVALAEQLAARQTNLVAAYEALREQLAGLASDDNKYVACDFASKIAMPAVIARRWIDLHWQRCEASAAKETTTARLTMQAELLRRLEAANLRRPGREAELESVRLDMARGEAQAQAARESREIMQLQEELLLAQAHENPGFVVAAIALDCCGGPATIFPDWREFFTDREPRLWVVGRSPLASGPRPAAWTPTPATWMSVPVRAECGVPTFNSSTPFHEPSYAEYYAFGNRRTDAPPACRASPFGYPPWYLPGSSTNFK